MKVNRSCYAMLWMRVVCFCSMPSFCLCIYDVYMMIGWTGMAVLARCCLRSGIVGRRVCIDLTHVHPDILTGDDPAGVLAF